VVSKVRERLAVSKQVVKKFDIEECEPKKLNNVEVKGEYHTEI
jgi:hypothetical protein